MKRNKAVAMCAALSVAAAGLALATPSYADPVSSSYVLVGSDTLQDSGNALANGTNITGSSVQTTANGSFIASYDAFGSAAIQTKTAGVYFARPAGSGDGIKALSRSIDGGAFSVSGNATPAVSITGQVDIARTSSGAGATANANGLLAYVPYGRDALSYAYVGAGLGEITTAQLKSVYDCSLTSIGGVPVTPVLPQAASGTRKFFLSAIGNPTLGSCVVQSSFAENDGSVITNGQIIPFSVASWVAQKNGAGQNRTGAASLGSPLNGIEPFTGTGANLVPNATYYSNATFGRETYLVVEYARINAADARFDPALAALVDPTKAKSLTNFSNPVATSGAVKKKFGFLAPSSTTVVRANLT
ncbi:hypothetical protein B0I08_10699 [Glaciihabitans tibetensis]|uniref:ABC-type phosphate transport system substrate-binding protein n=1 Tax=Glaciihabitans tibetensis TaxID=1266600 RepID=A0A2T0VBC2_9MICO|nr:hypothetical protein [Glaciihabitans tibetensis]PRY67492.1 hypothetical protein B0I08_10699 [Glaciihabitans tibetensis]